MHNEHKSLRRRALEGIFFTAAGNTTLKFLSIVATFVILYNIVPYEYGVWRLLLSVLSVCGLLGLSGITGMLVADISREMGAGNIGVANAIIHRTMQYFLATGLFASIVLFAIAPIITHITGIGLTLYLQILSLTLFAAGLRQTYQIVFQSRMQPLRAQALQNTVNIVYLAGIGICIAYLHLGLLGLVIAYTISITLPVAVYAPFFLRGIHGTYTAEDLKTYSFRKALFGRGRWALAEDYASTINSSLWPWIAGATLSIADVGIISIALLMFSQVAALVPIQYVLRSVLPRIVSDVGRLNEWVTRGLRYTLLLQITIALAAGFSAALLFPYLAPQYVVAIPLFAALFVSLPFRVYGIVLTEWFYAQRAQKEFFMSNVIPMVIMIGPLPILLMWGGLFGFVLWYTALAALTVWFTLFYVKKMSGVHIHLFKHLLPDDRDHQLLVSIMGSIRSRINAWLHNG